jgi:hypothetical protein
MRIVNAEGGRAVSVRLDAASLARLQYLEMYYRTLGVKASHSALVRRALSALVNEVSAVVLRARKNGPEDSRALLASKLIVWEADNCAGPPGWRGGPPALNNTEQFPQFPTWKEAQSTRPHIAPTPLNSEGEMSTNEKET